MSAAENSGKLYMPSESSTLIAGGTGSLGHAFVPMLLPEYEGCHDAMLHIQPGSITQVQA